MLRTFSWTASRRFVGAVAVGATLIATSGCTVPVDAVAGISVTGDGHLVGVMMICGHHIDGATLYVDSTEVKSQTKMGSWTADRPLTAGLVTWLLDAPAVGWTATKPLAPLTAGTTYALYGWTKDNSWSSASVSFTLTDWDRLTPGRVRYDDLSASGGSSPTAVPTADFTATACRDT
ncbi:hypothetical protein OH809_40130 [Streptomyces sp. NBC_00873]|uniref:hypothetical protein n=1 Tax=unclassified Streptomyces TaxID=2593676 RepID=UPI003867AE4C|nr:hypothetical protein OH809_40130 [Streptomyces sp. NBC_00873]WTA41848.1 hypothetical protein OH821_03570 [Streptomyces sp. NBC_00842]